MAENIGKITQVMGPVVDVEFEQGNLPEILNGIASSPTRQSMMKKTTLSLKPPSIWATTS
jgi:F0F1-type ATP synthase beta subunit